MHLARTWPLTATALSVALLSGPARAVGQAEASPTGKGIVGGALLGGETLLLVTAAIDPEPKWIYLASGVAGAVGGGVGGYYVEQTGSAQASMFLLAGGMALLIPTLVAVFSATAYEPPVDYTQDQAPADEPVAEPPRPEEDLERWQDETGKPPVEGRRSPRKPARLGLYHPLGQALVGAWADGTLALSMPALEIGEVFTPREQSEYGVEQQTQFRMALFNFNF